MRGGETQDVEGEPGGVHRVVVEEVNFGGIESRRRQHELCCGSLSRRHHWTPCQGDTTSTKADAARCCATPVKCSTVESTSSFCGTGKVYNSAAATTDCAVAPCQGDTTSTKADVARCCKAA